MLPPLPSWYSQLPETVPVRRHPAAPASGTTYLDRIAGGVAVVAFATAQDSVAALAALTPVLCDGNRGSGNAGRHGYILASRWARFGSSRVVPRGEQATKYLERIVHG